jgi:signal recognition particle subunit SRP54
MFESLSEKLQEVFRRLSGRGRLTEADVDAALREVRVALLDADVNYRVVRDFIGRVRERAVGAEVLRHLSPAQQVIKVVYEELINLLGPAAPRLEPPPQPPGIVMLVGLQGSGKTTTAAKLALHLRRQGQRPYLVAADPYRPAAGAQLEILGRQLDIPVYNEPSGRDAVAIAENGLRRARVAGATWVILDTAGRLHIDDALMAELEAMKARLRPHEVLLVADAMTGQDAVRTAEEFHRRVGLTGVILTKLDGDARGGAALSIRAVTGVPIRFIGVGEKADALEPFYPDRLASRILGMGDVLTLIEKAQEAFDREQARALEKKLRTATFTLEDFLNQLQQVKKMGPLQQLLEMIPGFSQAAKHLPAEALDERQLKRVEAIILSMTPEERRRPEIIDGSRKRRIARGSGTSIQEVNQLLNQFFQTRRLMKELMAGGGRRPGFRFPF